MRILVIVILLSLVGNVSAVQAREGVPEPQARTILLEKTDPIGMVDCTIRVNFTTDEGHRIEGELTFVGIPWWECAAIKVGNFFSKIF